MGIIKRITALLLTAAVLLSLCGITALADDAAANLTAAAPVGDMGAGGPGAGPGGPGGGSTEPVDLTGMLALSQYVFTEGAVSADYYGVYKEGGEGTAAFVPDQKEVAIDVYLDSGLKKEAEGVSAAVDDGIFTMTGASEEGNVVYYLTTGPDAYTTVLYVVNDQAEDNAVLTLADGTTMDLTTLAPNMAYGDYDAEVGQNAIDGEISVYIGGNRTAVSLSDLTDTENYAENEDAAAWYLRSGITNSGATLTTFGDTLYGFEYAMGIYRLFQIVVNQTTLSAGFVDPADNVGAMFSNDQFSDAVSATVSAGIWNGIYTEISDVMDKGEGFYLLKNIDGVTELGTVSKVTVRFAYVGIYNALQSCFTMLSEEGRVDAARLEEAAAAYDGARVSAPGDYSDEAKIYAVADVILDADGTEAVLSADEKLSKIEAVSVLYAVRNDVKSKESPDADYAAQTGSVYSDDSQYFKGEYASAMHAEPGEIVDSNQISKDGAAILADDINGTLTLKNSTVSLVGNSDKAADFITTATDPNTQIDGAEAAMGTSDVGFIYNATGRNAFYRMGVGTAIAVWGDSTDVVMTSDNGTIVLDAEATGSAYQPGTMAGGAFVGFGGSLLVRNALAYSSGQHLTNNLYNGTVHYLDAYAVSSGRVYSSDFWGGYQVYENSIATGGAVTDEPTTLIVKNSVYGNSVGGNGFASQYFENSVLNVSTAAFQNTTSLITDAGAFTLVNSVMNNSAATLLSTSKCEDLIATFADSTINLKGNVLATLDNSLNNPREELTSNYASEIIVKLYGENTIVTSDGMLTGGDGVTIYGRTVDAEGNALEIPGAVYVDGEEYGTLVVTADPNPFADVEEGSWYEDAVIWAYANGVVNGTTETTFSPDQEITRAQFVTMLYRQAGEPSVEGVENPFTDVEDGKYYTDAVLWAVSQRITSGITETLFAPDTEASRAQVVTFLYRYAGSPAVESPAAFTDLTAAWYADAVAWAAAEGIVKGMTEDTFGPAVSCTRAMTVTILYRMAA